MHNPESAVHPNAAPMQSPMAASAPSITHPELLRLRRRHPELADALEQHASDLGATLEVSPLPEHSRRFIWRLYRKHDPAFAQWLSDVAEARDTMGATLRLRALDILKFIQVEHDGRETLP